MQGLRLSTGRYPIRIRFRLTSAALVTAGALIAAPAASADSFSLGVAAGEVTPNSAVLWGHADQAGETRVQVATDSGFNQVIRDFKVQALAANDFTVQRRITGLKEGTSYWYRFTSGAASSLDPPIAPRRV